MGRVTGDCAAYFLLVDVVVRTEYQAHGIGREIIGHTLVYVRQEMQSGNLPRVFAPPVGSVRIFLCSSFVPKCTMESIRVDNCHNIVYNFYNLVLQNARNGYKMKRME